MLIAESRRLCEFVSFQFALQAVAAFPTVTFIWKYEALDDDFAVNNASKLSNLVLTKWMPQTDLLSESCLLFVPVFSRQNVV